MQNVVLLMEPSDLAYDISPKAGNMYLNRFCIDEDAAFESTGVIYLFKYPMNNNTNENILKRNLMNVKGLRKSFTTKNDINYLKI